MFIPELLPPREHGLRRVVHDGHVDELLGRVHDGDDGLEVDLTKIICQEGRETLRFYQGFHFAFTSSKCRI